MDNTFSLAHDPQAENIRSEGWYFQFLALLIFLLSMICTGYVQDAMHLAVLRKKHRAIESKPNRIRLCHFLSALCCILILAGMWHLGMGILYYISEIKKPILFGIFAGDGAIAFLFLVMTTSRTHALYRSSGGRIEIESSWFDAGFARFFLMHRLRDMETGEMIYLPCDFWQREIGIVEKNENRLVLVLQDEFKPYLVVIPRKNGGLDFQSLEFKDINIWNRVQFQMERPRVEPGEFIHPTDHPDVLHSYIIENLVGRPLVHHRAQRRLEDRSKRNT
ncbi:MAG: hypothetical protein ACLFQ6_12750 [Candidatus Sumerlaeia bacterium]